MTETEATPPQDQAPAGPSPLLKLLLEFGPLLAFFITNARVEGDRAIFWATGVFMVAIVLSLAGSWKLERKLPTMPLITAVFVLVFGGLTLAFQDEAFIKLKPTIVNALFAAILAFGLWRGQLYIKLVFGEAFNLEDEGWRVLTLRWVGFFLFLAVVNEVVWRNFSTDTWVAFKVWGILPLTLVYGALQLPLIQRYSPDEAPR